MIFKNFKFKSEHFCFIRNRAKLAIIPNFFCIKYRTFIGKFESLQTDFAKVCKALNMPVQNLPHRNKSAQKGGISGLRKFGRRFVKQPESLLHLLFSRGDKIKSKDYRDYYTPGLIVAVEELYKEDVTAFDYSFED